MCPAPELLFFFWNFLLDICRMKLILSTNPWKTQPKMRGPLEFVVRCSVRLDQVWRSAARRRCSDAADSHLLEPDLPPGGGGLQGRSSRLSNLHPAGQVYKRRLAPRLSLVTDDVELCTSVIGVAETRQSTIGDALWKRDVSLEGSRVPGTR